MKNFKVGDKVKLVRVLHKDEQGKFKTDKNGNVRLYTRYTNGSRPETKPAKITEVVQMGDRTFYRANFKKEDVVIAEQIESADETTTGTVPIPKTVAPIQTFLIGNDEDTTEDLRNLWY